jgi:hypothetical protein
VGGPVGAPGHVDRGADRTGDAGAQAIGTDDDPGVQLDGIAGQVASSRPDHPTGVVATDASDGDAEPNVGACGTSGVGNDGVEHVPTGSDQVVDPGAVLDAARDRLARRLEGDLANRGCTARQDLVEQAQRASWTTPLREMEWVDSVSLGKWARSRTTTSWPMRARSNAVAPPAARAPTTTTSCWPW